MPYLKEIDRLKLLERKANIGGELNYLISKLLNDFVATKGLSYAVVNEAMGAVESAKLEFYRRVAAPYEDKKCIENGEVYTVL